MRRCLLGFGLIALCFAVSTAALSDVLPSDLKLEDVWTQGDVPQELLDTIEQTILSAIRGQPIPGLMVGFDLGGSSRGILCFGWSDLQNSRPMNTSDSFYIGSATKMLTAAAILQLYERQALDLDGRVSEYLDEIPTVWRNVTIRNLLEHTSGIPAYIATEEGQALRWTSEPVPYETVLDILRQLPPDFPAGMDWQYTNSNFYLLGYIVESVTGLRYGEYMDTNIFGPLNMTYTGYDVSHRPSNLITAYRRDDLPDAEFTVYPLPNVSLVHGAGGVYSTTEDLLQWLDGWTSSAILSQESVDLMLSPLNVADLPLGEKYGTGCMVWDASWTGLPLYAGHLGTIHGNLCFAVRFPEQQVSLVLYSNSYDLYDVLAGTAGGSSDRLHRQLAEILLSHVEPES